MMKPPLLKMGPLRVREARGLTSSIATPVSVKMTLSWLPFLTLEVQSASIFVTLHHEMSRNMPDGHVHVFIFSESKFYTIYNGENHFQIRGLFAELHVFEYGETTFSSFEKKNLL